MVQTFLDERRALVFSLTRFHENDRILVTKLNENFSFFAVDRTKKQSILMEFNHRIYPLIDVTRPIIQFYLFKTINDWIVVFSFNSFNGFRSFTRPRNFFHRQRIHQSSSFGFKVDQRSQSRRIIVPGKQRRGMCRSAVSPKSRGLLVYKRQLI